MLMTERVVATCRVQKCEGCKHNMCCGKYEKRDFCCDPEYCTCTCQESSDEAFWKAFGTIAVGVGTVAGGVALTVATGGVGAVVAGGLLVGGGVSLITNPIGKKMAGERLNADDLAKDVMVGSAIGILSGGMGAGASALTQGTHVVVQAAAQVGAAGAAGATGGAANEAVRFVRGEEVTTASLNKSVLTGGVSGLFGGVGGQAAGAACRSLSDGVAKAMARIGMQTATAALTDTGLQIVEAGGGHRLRKIPRFSELRRSTHLTLIP